MSLAPSPRLFFLVGPTAVGKTAIAAEVAAECNCEIVSADAFQVYQGMEIVTAKPSPETLGKVHHHMIGVVPASKCFDVARFHSMAAQSIADIITRDKYVLVAGGTGLYVRALTHGLADLPTANPAIREELAPLSLNQLQTQYRSLDPEGFLKIDSNNPRRLTRAIEVCILTGRPFSDFRKEWERQPDNIGGFLLQRDREDLYRRIELRTEEMVRSGLFEEIQDLSELSPTASQAIGVSEAQQFIRGEITKAEAINRIQQLTRNYAKRQMTWFKKEAAFAPIDAAVNNPATAIIREVRNFFCK